MPLERYAGDYTSPLLRHGGRSRSRAAGCTLRYGTGFAGPLEHWHYDTFRAVWDARWRGTSQATFQIDAAGRVASVTTNGATFARVER